MNTSLLWLAIFAIVNRHSVQAGSHKAGPNEIHSGLRRTDVVSNEENRDASAFELDLGEQSRHRRRRRVKSTSKSCKSGKGKGSKSAADCDDEEEDVVTIQQCEGLSNLVFDMTTRVRDLGSETVRFRSLTDELEVTRVLAQGGARGDTMPKRRQEEVQDLFGQRQMQDDIEDDLIELENRLSDLDQVKELLSSENNRVEDLNRELHQSAVSWILLNTDLTDANADLLSNIGLLTAENAALQAERDELSDQIDDLGDHIENLNGMLDDHSELNGQLNASTLELMEQIARLEAANEDYAGLNADFAARIAELESQNLELASQNSILAGLNQDLNVTAQNLEEQADRLEGEVDELDRLNSELGTTIDDLRNETARLEQVNDQLEDNVDSLQAEVDSFVNKTAELEGINQGLETIVSFLNETSGNLDETYDALTEFLAQQIDAYHTIAIETLNNVYIQRVGMWDCGYRDYFGDEPFGLDEDLPIPANKLDAVITYVENRVLKQLCLTKNDFEHYLETTFLEPIYTSNHFVSGISDYTTMAMNYYFPDTGEVGLTDEDWALAGFACENLPNDKRFLMRHS